MRSGRLAGVRRRLIAVVAVLAMVPAAPSYPQTTTTYRYDAVGRLVEVQDSNVESDIAARPIGYGYDAAGNRTRAGGGAAEEYAVVEFHASSTDQGTTGRTPARGLRDIRANSLDTVHLSDGAADAWIYADLGVARSVGAIDVAAARLPALGLSEANLNGSKISWSQDAVSWTDVENVTGVASTGYRSIAVTPMIARYWRILRPAGHLALGEFRLFSKAPPSGGVGAPEEEGPPGNHAPVANADALTVALNTAGSLNPITNDTDADGDVLHLVSVGPPPSGQAVANLATGVVTYTPLPGFVGAETFSYRVADIHNVQATGYITVTVSAAANRAPTARPDAITSNNSAVVLFNPLLNDDDPDGEAITLVTANQPSHGEVLFYAPNQAVVYVPAAHYSGPDSFTYVIQDARGATATGQVSVTVTAGPNRSPVANADFATAQSGEPTTYYPMINDSDPDGDPIHVFRASVATPNLGTVTHNPATGAVTYTPAAGFTGEARIYYGISDPAGAAGSNAILFTVVPAGNHAPVAVNDTRGVRRDTPLSFSPQVNDTDQDGDVLMVTSASTPAHGTVAIATPGASLTYTPAAGYTGPDSFTYTVSDGQGGGASGTVALSVTDPASANAPPAPVNDAFSMATDTRLTFDPRLNDVEPDGDGMVITAIGAPSHGAAVITNSAGAISYRPAAGYAGPDSFSYTISDGHGGSATATINMTVYAPRGFSLSPAVDGKTHWNLDVDGSLSLPDAGLWRIIPDRTFQVMTKAWAAAGGPVNPGGATGVGGAGGYASGAVTLQQGVEYILWVGSGGRAPYGGSPIGGTAWGNIYAGGGGGFSGVTIGTQGWLMEGQILIAGGGGGAGWGADGGAGGGSGGQAGASYQAAAGGAGGTQTSGSTEYLPAMGGVAIGGHFAGAGGAGYHGGLAGGHVALVGGGGGGGGSGFLRPTSVTAGVLMGGNRTIPGNSNDPDRGAAGLPALTPGAQSGPGKVILVGIRTLPLADANGAPTAGGDSRSIRTGDTLTLDPRTNDSDPDLDALAVTAVGTPSHGVATLGSGGGSVSYVSTLGYTGPDSFSYTISDGRGGTATGTVSVTVVANVAPTAANDNGVAAQGSLTLDPRTNDSDPEGDPLTITAVSTPAHGTATIVNSGGAISYTATSGYAGPDSFTYTISDGRGGTATATVNVTVFSNHRIFTISPAVNGRTTWNLDLDGSLSLPVAGTWTLTPQTNFMASTKAWGGGGGAWSAPGGGGGYAGGSIRFQAGVTYRLDVGAGAPGYAARTTGGAPGGGGGGGLGVGGGGFTGVRKPSNEAVLIAGAGGGGAWGGNGGGPGGGPGGGAAYMGGAATDGTGGGGGGGYSGGLGGGANAGGGGGSSYANPAEVSASVLTAASGTTPGASTDPDRGTAGAGALSTEPGSAGRLLLVGVAGTNAAPVAAGDSLSTTWMLAATLDPRTNDNDPNGDILTITAIGTPSHGTAVIGGGGVSVTYTPIAPYSGSDSFSYTVVDGRGGTSTATISVTVTAPPNTAPTAVDDTVIAKTDTPLSLDPRINDSDAEQDVLTVLAVSAAGHGIPEIISSGAGVRYTPATAYAGSDSFSYTLSDGRGGTATATVNVTVVANLPPVAVDDSVVATHAPLTFDPRSNDSDAEGDPLTIAAVSIPAHGVATIVSSGGAIRYASTAGYTGPDSFTYTISDDEGRTATAAVSVAVAPSRIFTISPAVDGHTLWNLDIEGPLNLPAAGTWTLTPQNTFTALTKAWGAGGGNRSSLGGGGGGYAGGSVQYQAGVAYRLDVGAGGLYPQTGGAPGGGRGGTEAAGAGGFTGVRKPSNEGVLIAGGGGGGGRGSGTPGGGGGGGPGGGAQYVGGNATHANGGGGGGGYSGGIGANASAGGGGGSSYAHPTEVADGVLIAGSVVTPGASTDPDRGAAGVGAAGNGAGSQGMLLLVGVVGTNAAPVLFNDSISTTWLAPVTLDPRANDNDPNGDSLTITAIGTPSHGTAVIGGGGTSVTYTPTAPYSGPDSFSYTVTDSRGATATATISVTVTAPPNTAPITANDTATVRTNHDLTLDPRINDSDAEQDDLTVLAVSAASHGITEIISSGAGVRYTPATAYAGSDSFSYTLSDGRGGTATGTVNVTVVANVLPVAVNDTVGAPPAGLTFDPRSNDSDPESDPLTVTAVSAPAHGAATIVNSGGAISYLATSGYWGPDSFTYTISDGQGGTATATVNVTVSSIHRIFTISPAVDGHTLWNLDIEGPLNLPAAGTWTLTPQNTFTALTKAWGAGGGNRSSLGGGGGGYAGGSVQYQAGVAYRLDVGAGGLYPQTGGAPGGGRGGTEAAGAGGFTGVRKPSNEGVLIAGGGGGGGRGSGTPGGGGGGGPGGGAQYVGGNATHANGGGGGGGYSGGIGANASAGGGGGSSYAHPTEVADGVLIAGSVVTPGASTDPDRGAAGVGAAGNGAGSQGMLLLVGVVGTNAAPVLFNDSISTTWLAPVTLDPRANDNDPNGDSLTITAIGTPSHGTAVIGGGGTSVTYTPTAPYSGPDSFSYTVTDSRGATATATISVTIGPV